MTTSVAPTTAGSASRDFTIIGRHLPQLDGLRGMAIFLVIYYHLAHLYNSPSDPVGKLVYLTSQIGWSGVDLFFVISGFLITGILVESRDHKGYFRTFWARRFLRIFPIYYVVLAGMVLLPAFLPASLAAPFVAMQEKQVWFWTYTTNFLFAIEGSFNETPAGYFWSLAVEEQYYLLWPLVIALPFKRRLASLCVVLLAINIALRVAVLAAGHGTIAAYTLPFTHIDGLLVGSFIALTLHGDTPLQRLLHFSRMACWASALVLAVIWINTGSFLFWDPWVAFAGYTLLAFIFGYALLRTLCAEKGTRLYSFLVWTPLRSLGRYSYAVYLVHVPIGHLLRSAVFDPADVASGPGQTLLVIAHVALGTLLSWAVAYVSWHVFEKRVLYLKKYFPYEKQTTQPA